METRGTKAGDLTIIKTRLIVLSANLTTRLTFSTELLTVTMKLKVSYVYINIFDFQRYKIKRLEIISKTPITYL